MKCRHCHQELDLKFIDLGVTPPSNAYINEFDLQDEESKYPLKVMVCSSCWLVQTSDFTTAKDLFTPDYAYFSSFSTSWLLHAESYVAMVVERFNLGRDSLVVEIASNDGYLLQYVQARNIRCLGVEPTSGTAAVAKAKGIDTIEDFFGEILAAKLVGAGNQADLTIANNVLAHVPDINDFVSGFGLLLKPSGVATFEFPHLMKTVSEHQFDTIYHEHFSYLSLTSVFTVFINNGLTIFDVEEIGTHGGSLRIFAQRSDSMVHKIEPTVQRLLKTESDLGIKTRFYYHDFQIHADRIKQEFIDFLSRSQSSGALVVGYGAAAKGVTLLNYAGVGPELISFVVDRNPAKIGKYIPGCRIPIVEEAELQRVRPDYVIIFPWNLKSEIACQLDYVNDWGGRLMVFVPEMSFL